MKQNKTIIVLLVAFSLLMSIPYLIPHMGWVALFALVPLLCAERLASIEGKKHFFWWYFASFVVFYALTTWWVCKATVGGGIFAVFVNALYISLVFKLFRLSKKRFSGALPYIFLAVTWIAWERCYLNYGEIAFPWVLLGNAFARTTSLVQWYELTGIMGGALWILASNLSIFGLMVVLSDGSFQSWNPKARVASLAGSALILLGPAVASEIRYFTYTEQSEGTLPVTLAQSNFDPWHKLHATSQQEQNAQVVGLFNTELPSLKDTAGTTRLLMLPESFSSDIWMDNPEAAPTWRTFSSVVKAYPGTNLLFGASTHKLYLQKARPSIWARRYGDVGWYESFNTAFMTDATGRADYTHKTKLVVGTELTPYPKLFAPLDDKLGGLMGRCIPQGYAKPLDVVCRDTAGVETGRIAIGTPICYESIYPEFCTEYVRKGAKALAVITNDGWWGNTAGYRQHFSYSRLRAIELRRDIARCANTGISGFINQRGDVVSMSGWWVPAVLSSEINLSSKLTFFASHGDVTGRVCTFVFLLLLLSLLVKFIAPNRP